ncbi:MAG: DUF4190 domain-containing protein [Acidobacteria bacterium]|nr:DUF4190 domain-containing protein [Acidobacteriota bacterium]
MFCDKCGTAVREGSKFCDQCGQAFAASPQQPIPPPVQPQAGGGETSGKALASMVTGIFGLLLFPIGIAAIVLGHMSRSEIRKSNGRLKGDGMATAGLVMGYGAFAIIPFILIIAAIAIPNLLRARMVANETAAVEGVRTINSAEITYHSTYPQTGFTCSLSDLGGIGTSTPAADHAQLIEDNLASGLKHGYRFELRNCVNSETEGKYQVVAYPVNARNTGTRAFCSDETQIVRVDVSGSADDCLSSGEPLQ